MEKLIQKKIRDHIYIINYDGLFTSYIVIGNKKALVIDTMVGALNMKEIVQSYTDLPIILVNTHAHLDHVGGNFYFEEAYMHPEDIAWVNGPQETARMIGIEKIKNVKSPKYHPILPGYILDLGGIELEVFSLAGHTRGSIGLLDRKDRIFFTGDGIIPQIWMHLDESVSLHELKRTLNDLQSIRNEYDVILHGHTADVVYATLYDELMIAVDEVINGEKEHDTPFELFPGAVKHPFHGTDSSRFIVYRPN